MTRAVILVLDSFGIGATDDASQFGDVGANTLGLIAERRARAGRPLAIPNLAKLGLLHAARDSSGRFPDGCDANVRDRRRLWLCGRAQHGQGHAKRALGNGRSAGALRMGILSRSSECVSGISARDADRARPAAGRARQLPRIRYGDHRAAGRRARAHRQADRLHIGRQRFPDRSPRGGLRSRTAARPVPDRARTGGRIPDRPRHRTPFRGTNRPGFRTHG